MNHQTVARVCVALLCAAWLALGGCDARDTSFGEGTSSCVPVYGATLVDGAGGDGYTPCTAPDGTTVSVPPGGGWGIWVCGTCGQDTYASVNCENGKLACIGGSTSTVRREVVSFCDFVYGHGDCTATGTAK